MCENVTVTFWYACIVFIYKLATYLVVSFLFLAVNCLLLVIYWAFVVPAFLFFSSPKYISYIYHTMPDMVESCFSGVGSRYVDL